MKKFLLSVATVIVVALVLSLYLHKDITDEPVYVTSDNCEECHQANYDSWKENTLHPYMFRPVTSPQDILGDFDSNDPAVTFRKEEIEYVVGNKWEQVYVRMIDGEYYPFPAKWYVIQKRWVPYKVNNWHDVKMSYKCNGCHTTGFDANTLQFSEFGIGCEACHGPGSTHVQNETMQRKLYCSICHDSDQSESGGEKDIIRSVSASVCGQCHNRGTNTKGEIIKGSQFNFPVGFKPGDDIRTAIDELTPGKDKKGKYWWGNGLSKNRHQEFSDWNNAKHSKALKKLHEGLDDEQQRGKLTEECLHCHSTDYRHAPTDSKPTLSTARFGITCVACHEPHGHDKKLPGFGDGTTMCGGCHIDSMAHDTDKHYPCPTSAVGCADCHMPRIVKTGGFFSLRSHGFRIVPPQSSKDTGMPNSCQNGGCHEDKSLDWAIEAFKEHYPYVKFEPVNMDATERAESN